MKIIELVQAAKQEDADVFGKVNDQRAARIVRAVLDQLRWEVLDADEGELAVAGFGKFVVKQVEVEKDGVKSTRRRVVFRPVNPKKAH